MTTRHGPPPAGPAERDRPVRILQVGGGVFLRGFLDWMATVAHERGTFAGSVAVALSTDRAVADRLRAQDMRFTVLVRGLEGGREIEERRVVDAVSTAFAFADDWDQAVAIATSPALQVVVSNTTEAGLADRPEPPPGAGAPPLSYPARLAALLHARWRALGDAPEAGLLVLPCELVENNGAVLREAVLAHARRWSLAPAFGRWVETACSFRSTLVDRIVPGFPAAEADALFARWGYRDALLTVAEPFHLWAIEGGDAADRARLPFAEAGLGVHWTRDLTPWRESKLRVLNGGHAAIVHLAFLAGHGTVGEAVSDPAIAGFLDRLLARDILPFLPLPEAEARAYADRVLERFRNPFIRHDLLAIAAGSTAKWRIRLVPPLRATAARAGTASPRLALSLAALLRFARGRRDATGAWRGTRDGAPYPIRDDDAALARLNAAWDRHGDDAAGLARDVLADATLWGTDLAALPGFAGSVAAHLAAIARDGAAVTLAAAAARDDAG